MSEGTEHIIEAPTPAQPTEGGTKKGKLPVIELFGPTIQGEGPLAGTKTLFLRLGLCDYRCAKCDSLHAVDPAAVKANAEYLTQRETAERLIELAKGTGTPWVTLSGGNPVMWDLADLVQLLHEAGLGIAVETQGSLYKDWLEKCQMVVVSPKGPGMGEVCDEEKLEEFFVKLSLAHQMQIKQFGRAWGSIAVKVVVFDQRDFEFALDVKRLMDDTMGLDAANGLFFLSLGNPTPPVLGPDYQPITDGSVDVLDLLARYRTLLEDFVGDERFKHAKFLPQMHVLVYGNDVGR